MITDSIQILIPETAEDFKQYYDLRWRILREPWQQPRGSEQDELESASWHRMACAEGRIPVGVARLHLNSPEQAQIRYMAVETTHREKGIGTALVRSLENQALCSGAQEILLHARDETLGFYTQLGYQILGPSHTLFESIHHHALSKQLV
jgi:predicted GNAT family acetyltransferase